MLHADIDIPGVSIPDAGDVARSALQALLNFIFGRPDQVLEELITAVHGGSVILLSVNAVQAVYDALFGLAMVISLLGTIVLGGQMMLSAHRGGSVLTAISDMVKIFALGTSLPLLAVAGAWFNDSATRQSINLATIGASDKTAWQQALTFVFPFDKIVGGGLLQVVTQLCAAFLRLFLVPAETLVGVYMVLVLVGYALTKVLARDSRANRWTWALLITTLLARPVISIVLAVGGTAIGIPNPNLPNAPKAGAVMALTLLSVFVVVMMFVGSNHVVTQLIRSRVDVEGKVSVDGEVDSHELETDIAAAREARSAAAHTTASHTSPGRAALHHAIDMGVEAGSRAAHQSGHPVVGAAASVTHTYIKSRRERNRD